MDARSGGAVAVEEYDGIWRENEAAVVAFLTIANQFNVLVVAPGRCHVLGLDYGRVEAGLRLAGISLTAAEFADLRLVEHGAIQALNEALTRQ